MMTLKKINWLLIVVVVFSLSACNTSELSSVTGSDSDSGTDTIASNDEETATSSDGSSGDSIPSVEVSNIKLAIKESNPSGIMVGNTFSDVQLPEASFSDASESVKYVKNSSVTYSVSGLPEYLDFDASSRTISLHEDYDSIPKGAARRNISIKYRATNGEEYSEASIVLNDIDGDGVNDSDENEASVPPLVNRSYGYVKLNANSQAIYMKSDTEDLYLPSGIVTIPSNRGMKVTEADDEDGDFDGDGLTNIEELKVDGNPFVYTGVGTFTTSGNYSTPRALWMGISHGDFNNDGYQDIVTPSHSGNKIYYFENNKDGTLKNYTTLAVGNGAQDVVVADFNNDGWQDMAIPLFGDDEVEVLINNKVGGFTHGNYNAGPNGGQPRAVASGDVNGDGYQDLVVTHSSYCHVSVLMNNQDGTFANRIDYKTCDSHFGNAQEDIILVDIDNDFDLDIVMVSLNVVVLKNNGNGTYASYNKYGGGGFGINAYDCDDDGDLDILYSGSGGYIGILINDGDGTLGMPTHNIIQRDWETGEEVLDDNGDPVYIEIGVSYQVASDPRGSIMSTDLNGDGMIDIVTANHSSSSISILYGQAESDGEILGRRKDYTISHKNGGNFTPYNITSVDLDNDNDLDLIVGGNRNDSGITVLLNDSNQ